MRNLFFISAFLLVSNFTFSQKKDGFVANITPDLRQVINATDVITTRNIDAANFVANTIDKDGPVAVVLPDDPTYWTELIIINNVVYAAITEHRGGRARALTQIEVEKIKKEATAQITEENKRFAKNQFDIYYGKVAADVEFLYNILRYVNTSMDKVDQNLKDGKRRATTQEFQELKKQMELVNGRIKRMMTQHENIIK